MENAVNVKAFWVKSPEDTEIRRFTLDPEVASNYEYLKGKISTIFPSLMRQEFAVFWKDDEGDMVNISSDEELVQAFTFGTRTELFRFTIVAAPQNSTQGGPRRTNDHLEHPGVECDACEASVVGLRFKCLVCPDYDLCENCCDKGTHNHHYMLRMATPAAPEYGPRCQRGGRPGMQNPPWWANFQGIGPWGGNMRRWWRNIMRQQQMQTGDGDSDIRADSAPPHYTGTDSSADPTADPTAAPTAAPNSDDEQREYLEHVGQQVQAILEPLGINVDVDIEDRMNPPNPGARRRWGGRGGRWQGQGGRGCPRQGNPACAANGRCKPDGECRKKCSQAGSSKPDEQCRKAAGCMRDPNANGPQVCPPRGSPPKVMEEPMEIKLVHSAEQPEVAPLVDLTADGQAAAAAPPQTMDVSVADDEESQSWVKVEPTKDMDVVEVEKPAETPNQANPSGPILYPSLSTSSATPNRSTSPPQPIVYPGETQAAASSSSPTAPPAVEETIPTQAQAGSQTSFRSQDSVPDAITEMDRKVAEAIDQMRCMGFHDEGGWMTALLYQHQGDIYKVIDTVLRMAQNQNQGKK